jgi:hypothetical protein
MKLNPEIMMDAQTINKFPVYFRTRMFITMFTKPCQWTLFSVEASSEPHILFLEVKNKGKVVPELN